MNISLNKKKIITYAVGIAAGLALGAVYYKLVGCRTGTCPLTSTVLRSMIYGGVLGFLFAGIFVSK
jgi:hypothetical protein